MNTKEYAQELASIWYVGQGSYLYCFASTGYITDAQGCLNEIDTAWAANERIKYDLTVDEYAKNHTDLVFLAKFFRALVD